jgi:disulfide bond formation protein DsbB
MDVEAMQVFFALLALVALAGAVGIVVVRLVRPALLSLDAVNLVALPLAWLVALTSTLGSLYFSEVANYAPCRLCWYQRIAMYPLALILLIAVIARDPAVKRYAAPLAGVGLAISTYHYALEWKPELDTGACSVDVPCTFVWFRSFGFVSIPFMAMSGFAAILALLVFVVRRPPAHPPTPETDHGLELAQVH